MSSTSVVIITSTTNAAIVGSTSVIPTEMTRIRTYVANGQRRTIHINPDGRCVISENEMWLPGVYENIQAAKIAFNHDEHFLQGLQNQANVSSDDYGERYIRLADLRPEASV